MLKKQCETWNKCFKNWLSLAHSCLAAKKHRVKNIKTIRAKHTELFRKDALN